MTLDEIWSEYRGRIKSFLHARVSNPADVDDLLQEISIRVLRGLSTLEDQAKLQPWLFQIADRAIIDFYRKTARAKNLHPDDLWYTGDDPAVRQDLERCIEPFIRALPADMAALLTSIDLEGMSQQEYAATLGVPYSTLKSRVQKGRAELRRLFEDCCHMTRGGGGAIIDYQVKSGSCENC